jgi:hypothetical protein
MAGLQGIERLKARLPRKVKLVAAKAAGLGDVTFTRHESVEFYYEGELRRGKVVRIDADAVLVQDDDRQGLRRFRDDKIQGGPV